MLYHGVVPCLCFPDTVQQRRGRAECTWTNGSLLYGVTWGDLRTVLLAVPKGLWHLADPFQGVELIPPANRSIRVPVSLVYPALPPFSVIFPAPHLDADPK